LSWSAASSRLRGWLAVALAIGIVSTAEILIELFEYPLLYSDRFDASAYYDTLADMASTLVGAVLGIAVPAAHWWASRRGIASLAAC
jgi:hypothetical protein